MRYELAQSVGSTDVEYVKSLLAGQLRKISKRTYLDKGTLTASGIEASFGSINRKSLATFRFQASSARTLIVAEVLYRPSGWFWLLEIFLLTSLVGWVIPIIFYLTQRSTVKNALVDVLRRIQTEAEFVQGANSEREAFSGLQKPLNAGATLSDPVPTVSASDSVFATNTFAAASSTASVDYSASSIKAEKSNTAVIILGLTTLVLAVACAYLLGRSRAATPIAKDAQTPATTAPAMVSPPTTELHQVTNEQTVLTPTLTPQPREDVNSSLNSEDAQIINSEVEAFLQKWVNAHSDLDPEELAAFYAPEGVHYFLQPSVDRAFIKDYLENQSLTGIKISKYSMSEVHISSRSESSVVARFVKTIEYSKPESSGSTETPSVTKEVVTGSMLELSKRDGTWLITSERDFKN